jgi:glycosyltransferase involved in cell wall biosynthesis
MILKKVSIIVPAYNEEKRIGKMLKEYGNFFSEKNLDWEIIVVLNGCADKTFSIVELWSKEYSQIKSLNCSGVGKGLAITEGFKEALERDRNLIGFTDADCSTPPQAFFDLIEQIGSHEAIIANRWHKKSIILKKQGIKRRIMSRVFNFIVRSLLLIPYRDTQCGAKLIKKEPLENIIKHLCLGEWAFDINLLYVLYKNKYHIKEIPTIWEDHEASNVNTIKTSLRMFLSVMRMRFIYTPFERSRKILRPFIKILYNISK